MTKMIVQLDSLVVEFALGSLDLDVLADGKEREVSRDVSLLVGLSLAQFTRTHALLQDHDLDSP